MIAFGIKYVQLFDAYADNYEYFKDTVKKVIKRLLQTQFPKVFNQRAVINDQWLD